MTALVEKPLEAKALPDNEIADLSTEQAADLIGVSLPYFIQLLDAGQIPFHKVGFQCKVRTDALRRYMDSYQQEAVQALEEMTAEAQGLGLYE